MLKKSVTYEDFNGDMVTEDHFFHLSKADLVELEMTKEGGFSTWIQKIVNDEDGNTILQEFKNLLRRSYGVKSADGKRFIKNPEITEQFIGSEAYSAIFMELVTDADAAVAFINGMVPKGLSEDVEKLKKSRPDVIPPVETPPVETPKGLSEDVEKLKKSRPDVIPPVETPPVETPKPVKVITQAEARAMDAETLKSMVANGATILPAAKP